MKIPSPHTSELRVTGTLTGVLSESIESAKQAVNI